MERAGPARGAGVRMERASKEMRYALRYLVSTHPFPYMAWARRHYRTRGLRVLDEETELVIEGFGRSGSTFAVDAFLSVQPEPVVVAHHTHAAAQVIEAARRGVPTLVLVREPADAVLAHMVRRQIGARGPLVAWIRYHRALLPYRDRIVVGRTADLSSGLGGMIREVNERFGSHFAEFDSTEENVARVFEGIERRNREEYAGAGVSLARPTPEREARKARVAHELEAPSLRRLLREAEEICARMVGGTGASA